MTTTASPVKLLDFAQERTTPFVIPYILIPQDHSLCFYTYDHLKSNVYVNLYVNDPKKSYTVKIRGDETDDTETIADNFVDEYCRSCEYYFDVRTESEEGTDEDGNDIEITRRVVSRCECFSDGIFQTTSCPAGHQLPDLSDDNNDEYEWTEEQVCSSPMMFMLEINPPDIVNDRPYPIAKLYAAMGFAKPIQSFDKSEYAWYLSTSYTGLNIYLGSPPAQICWGSDENIPQTQHLDEAWASYYSSEFNNDLLQTEKYDDYNQELIEDEERIDDFNSEQYEDEEDYKTELTTLVGSSVVVPTNSKTHIILSEGDAPAAGFIYLNKAVDQVLFNRMYVSGIPFRVKDPLTFNTVLLPIYRYEYVNPENSKQRINGYVTKPNRFGLAWFMASTPDTYNHMRFSGAHPFNTLNWYKGPDKATDNHLTIFGQIQL